jgi:hypothetical protein
MARFSDRMVPEVVQVFWAAMARGEFVTAAAAEAGTYREKGHSVAGRRGWHPPAARAESEGSLFDIRGAGGDRGGAGRR